MNKAIIPSRPLKRHEFFVSALIWFFRGCGLAFRRFGMKLRHGRIEFLIIFVFRLGRGRLVLRLQLVDLERKKVSIQYGIGIEIGLKHSQL
jgi:hypothetical protein